MRPYVLSAGGVSGCGITFLIASIVGGGTKFVTAVDTPASWSRRVATAVDAPASWSRRVSTAVDAPPTSWSRIVSKSGIGFFVINYSGEFVGPLTLGGDTQGRPAAHWPQPSRA